MTSITSYILNSLFFAVSSPNNQFSQSSKPTSDLPDAVPPVLCPGTSASFANPTPSSSAIDPQASTVHPTQKMGKMTTWQLRTKSPLRYYQTLSSLSGDANRPSWRLFRNLQQLPNTHEAGHPKSVTEICKILHWAKEKLEFSCEF